MGNIACESTVCTAFVLKQSQSLSAILRLSKLSREKNQVSESLSDICVWIVSTFLKKIHSFIKEEIQ